MKRTLLIIAMFVMAVLPSCKRSMTEIKNPADTNWITEADQTFETEFKAIWEAMNQSYVLWDIDTVNWDARRDKMINLGKKYDEMQKQGTLNFGSEEREAEMSKLFEGLLDHHLSIYIQNPYDTAMKRVRINPGTIEVEKRADYHEKYDVPFSYEVINSMIENGQLEAENCNIVKFYSTDFKYDVYLVSCLFNVDDGYVAYLRMSDYVVSEILKSVSSEEQNEAFVLLNTHFTTIKQLKEMGLLKGIILDNRGNNGGFQFDANLIVGPYVENDLLMLIGRTKNGLGKYDYSQWEETYIKSIIPTWYVGDLGNIPFVAMEDMNSVSMGEITGSCVSHLNSGIIIGERSHGGHGALNESYTYEQQNWCGIIYYDNKHHELYNPMECVKLWNNRTKQFEIQEGVGLIPDIEVKLDEAQLQAGYDNQLMRAIEYIKTGK